ncbi:MAG: P1 family peptidase [Deltaproteobacteria bacterium]|nr:P1 family peptidase [Deltaproteobacteria bacterium]
MALDRTNDSITCVPSLRVGQAQNDHDLTGCTVLLSPQGAVAAMVVLGSAPGTRQTDSLRPGHLVSRVHGLCLTGGSGFGLRACDGVTKVLVEQGVGLTIGEVTVPIVPGAVIFDLRVGAPVWPDAEMGEIATRQALGERGRQPVTQGCVGAGTGATVGKLFGPGQSCKSGLGTAGAVRDDGLAVGALAVVNAFGDVRDPQSNRLLAGLRRTPESNELADTSDLLRRGDAPNLVLGAKPEATTLAVVATNAHLDSVHAAKIASMAAGALHACLSPAATHVDGDIVFCLGIGNVEVDMHQVAVLARDRLEEAIVSAVLQAQSAGGLPAARDLTPTSPLSASH